MTFEDCILMVKRACDKLNMNVDDNTILNCATQIYFNRFIGITQ